MWSFERDPNYKPQYDDLSPYTDMPYDCETNKMHIVLTQTCDVCKAPATRWFGQTSSTICDDVTCRMTSEKQWCQD